MLVFSVCAYMPRCMANIGRCCRPRTHSSPQNLLDGWLDGSEDPGNVILLAKSALKPVGELGAAVQTVGGSAGGGTGPGDQSGTRRQSTLV